jgi:transcriptional regulator with AAA-type ATPase domain
MPHKAALFSSSDRRFVEAVADLAYCNPFVLERIDLERQALGVQFDSYLADWNVRAGAENDHSNLTRLIDRSREVLEQARTHWGELVRDDQFATEADAALYGDLALFVVYHDQREALDRLVAAIAAKPNKQQAATVYRRLLSEVEAYLHFTPQLGELLSQMPHIFAGFFQLRRAFRNIFLFIVGGSKTTANLRAAVWQSIFTHDMRRYRRLLFDRMGDYATLITGPTGTGKELVAQAIGRSRYIPFDATSGSFGEAADESFFPINLSALSPTLIESELFGHARGALTGAVSERAGWLEACPRSGTVFLDEIGELDGAIQVKLLRVLQSREFSRLGETKQRQFQGKIIAATNRSLTAEMRQQRFREDLYYRLCSDMVEVPSLRQRLDEDPDELRELVTHIAQRLVGSEGKTLADEVLQVIRTQIGLQYTWPGNIRELEQCVRNVLIRRSYCLPQADTQAVGSSDPIKHLAEDIRGSQLTADELVRRYCQIVYRQTGSYEATARRLGLDRRTVKAKVTSES